MAATLWERLGSAMTKMGRNKTAAKATKKSKTSGKKGGVTASKRKVAAKKKITHIAKEKLARKKIRKPPPERIPDRVVGAISAVVDTLTDAERLLHKMHPETSREPE
jgi:hypothetical protein